MSSTSALSQELARLIERRIESSQTTVNGLVDVYDRLPVGHHSVDRSGVFTQMNDSELRWLGYTREEVLGKLCVPHIMTAASCEMFKRNFARLAEGEGLQDLEYEFVRKDGSTFPVLVNVFTIRDAQGGFAGGRATVVDISALKRAQQALRRGEEGLRQAQSIAHFGNHDAIYSGVQGNWETSWSAEAYAILGLDPAQGSTSTAQFVERVVHEDDRVRIAAVVKSAFRDGDSIDCQYRIVRGDGQVRHVHHVVQARRGLDGEVSSFFGVLHDITDLKLAQQSLEESERRFRHLVENGHDGIVLLSESGTILYVSRTTERMLGFRAAEMIGRPSNDFCHPHDALDVRASMAKLLLRQSDPLTHEFRLRRKDGSWCWIEAQKSNHLGDPAVGAIVCNFRDITERKAAGDELRRSNEKLRELSAHLQSVRESERTRLARELHDELGATLGAVKMYLGGANQANASVSGLALERVRSLVNGAMSATRRITTELRPSILDHRGLWAAVAWLAQDTCNSAGLAFRTESEEVHDLALSDKERTAVFRIAQEALRNTVLHAAAKTVNLNARRAEGALVLEIRDDGVGVDDADLCKADSWGVVGMQERAAACGGSLCVSRVSDSGGTLVQLRLPVEA